MTIRDYKIEDSKFVITSKGIERSVTRMPVNGERMPKEFWEDMRWALDHDQGLMQQYPDVIFRAALRQINSALSLREVWSLFV